MIRSLVIDRSIAPRNESLKPFTKVATNTISATPIMSAAEVTAVRPGLRAVFSRARRPAVGEAGSHGQSRGRRIHRNTVSAPPMASTTSAPTAPPALAPELIRMIAITTIVMMPIHTHPRVSTYPSQRTQATQQGHLVSQPAQQPPEPEQALQTDSQHRRHRCNQDPREHRDPQERDHRSRSHRQKHPAATTAGTDRVGDQPNSEQRRGQPDVGHVRRQAGPAAARTLRAARRSAEPWSRGSQGLSTRSARRPHRLPAAAAPR